MWVQGQSEWISRTHPMWKLWPKHTCDRPKASPKWYLQQNCSMCGIVRGWTSFRQHTANIIVMSNPSAAIAAGWKAVIVKITGSHTKRSGKRQLYVGTTCENCQNNQCWCRFMTYLVSEFGPTTYMHFNENGTQIFVHSVTRDEVNFGAPMAKSHHLRVS